MSGRGVTSSQMDVKPEMALKSEQRRPLKQIQSPTNSSIQCPTGATNRREVTTSRANTSNAVTDENQEPKTEAKHISGRKHRLHTNADQTDSEVDSSDQCESDFDSDGNWRPKAIPKSLFTTDSESTPVRRAEKRSHPTSGHTPAPTATPTVSKSGEQSVATTDTVWVCTERGCDRDYGSLNALRRHQRITKHKSWITRAKDVQHKKDVTFRITFNNKKCAVIMKSNQTVGEMQEQILAMTGVAPNDQLFDVNLKTRLRQQTEQKAIIQDLIRQKSKRVTYEAVIGKSKVWKSFVRVLVDSEETAYVKCTDCPVIIKAGLKNGHDNLQKHNCEPTKEELRLVVKLKNSPEVLIRQNSDRISFETIPGRTKQFERILVDNKDTEFIRCVDCLQIQKHFGKGRTTTSMIGHKCPKKTTEEVPSGGDKLKTRDLEDSELKEESHPSKQKKIIGITKLEEAEDAGTDRGIDCTLIVTEGMSAKAVAVAGLGVVGRQTYGVYAMKGSLLNVTALNTTKRQIRDNVEINNLVKILGLEYGKKYSTPDDLKSLRYGRLLIMADADVDGSHFKGLIINILRHFWPELLAVNFLEQFRTPLVRAFKGAERLSFYSLPEFKEWQKKTKNTKSWAIRRYPGLGATTAQEAKEYFSDMVRHKKTEELEEMFEQISLCADHSLLDSIEVSPHPLEELDKLEEEEEEDLEDSGVNHPSTRPSPLATRVEPMIDFEHYKNLKESDDSVETTDADSDDDDEEESEGQDEEESDDSRRM